MEMLSLGLPACAWASLCLHEACSRLTCRQHAGEVTLSSGCGGRRTLTRLSSQSWPAACTPAGLEGQQGSGWRPPWSVKGQRGQEGSGVGSAGG